MTIDRNPYKILEPWLLKIDLSFIPKDLITNRLLDLSKDSILDIHSKFELELMDTYGLLTTKEIITSKIIDITRKNYWDFTDELFGFAKIQFAARNDKLAEKCLLYLHELKENSVRVAECLIEIYEINNNGIGLSKVKSIIDEQLSVRTNPRISKRNWIDLKIKSAQVLGNRHNLYPWLVEELQFSKSYEDASFFCDKLAVYFAQEGLKAESILMNILVFIYQNKHNVFNLHLNIEENFRSQKLDYFLKKVLGDSGLTSTKKSLILIMQKYFSTSFSRNVDDLVVLMIQILGIKEWPDILNGNNL